MLLFLTVCSAWLADRRTIWEARWSVETPPDPSANGYLIGRGLGKILVCRGCFDEKAGFRSESAAVSPNASLEVTIWYCVTGDNEAAFEWYHCGMAAVIGPADWEKHTWALLAPDWLLLILFGIGPGIWVLRYQTRRKHRRREAGLCGECGYDLRSSVDRCPECGTATAVKLALE